MADPSQYYHFTYKQGAFLLDANFQLTLVALFEFSVIFGRRVWLKHLALKNLGMHMIEFLLPEYMPSVIDLLHFYM